MTVAQRLAEPRGCVSIRMNDDEYLEIGETIECYERIDGVVAMAPSAMGWHKEVAVEIAFLLKTHKLKHPGVAVFAERNIRFARGPRATIY